MQHFKGGTDKGGHYDVANEKVCPRYGRVVIMWKLKGGCTHRGKLVCKLSQGGTDK